MKRNIASWISIVLAATLFPFIATAAPGSWRDQKEEDVRYLLKNSKVTLTSFYIEISPSTYLSYVDDDMQGWTNLSGGFILNHNFYFSVFLTLAPTVTEVLWTSEEVYATFRHAGLKFGYMHRTDRMVFWRANLAVGLGGGYTLSNDTSVLGGLFESWLYRAAMYSVEPSVGVGFNLLKWWRLYVDLGYRYLGPTDDVIDVNDDSVTVNISFGFGKYRYEERTEGQQAALRPSVKE
jgi:hypothetical protein